MKKLTGSAIINTAEGKRISYTFSEIDEGGNILEDNKKKSFVALDPIFLESIKQVEDYIIENKLT